MRQATLMEVEAYLRIKHGEDFVINITRICPQMNGNTYFNVSRSFDDNGSYVELGWLLPADDPMTVDEHKAAEQNWLKDPLPDGLPDRMEFTTASGDEVFVHLRHKKEAFARFA